MWRDGVELLVVVACSFLSLSIIGYFVGPEQMSPRPRPYSPTAPIWRTLIRLAIVVAAVGVIVWVVVR
jgi:hypothetical protein